jgi:hypothetical protein
MLTRETVNESVVPPRGAGWLAHAVSASAARKQQAVRDTGISIDRTGVNLRAPLADQHDGNTTRTEGPMGPYAVI